MQWQLHSLSYFSLWLCWCGVVQSDRLPRWNSGKEKWIGVTNLSTIFLNCQTRVGRCTKKAFVSISLKNIFLKPPKQWMSSYLLICTHLIEMEGCTAMNLRRAWDVGLYPVNSTGHLICLPLWNRLPWAHDHVMVDHDQRDNTRHWGKHLIK